MLRFLCAIFKIPYDTCLSCQTLKQERDYLREENKRLTDTILEIVKPKTFEAPPYEVKAVSEATNLFSRRKAALEEAERQRARVLRDSPHIAKSDETIERLEKELGVEEA